MSYYDQQTPEALWGIAMQRMAKIPLPVNRVEATSYLEHRRAVGTIKPPTLGRDADELKRLGCWAGDRPFRDVGRRGIVAFFGTLAGLEPGTRYKAYVVVRAFFRWLHDLDDDDKPPEFKGFKMKRPKRKRLRKEDLLTQDEFSKMLRFCKDSQERCLFAWAYEAGPRATEALAGDIRDVHKDDYGYVIHLRDVPGLKTGPRPLRAIQSAPYFDQWLGDHAMKDDGKAPIYYGMSNRAPFERMGYQTFYALVKRLARQAKISKNITPHLLRHTSATNAKLRGLDTEAMKQIYGWTDDSDMPAIYVHLSREDADNELLISHGLKPRSTEGIELTVACPKCSHRNLKHLAFCVAPRCGAPLTPKAEVMLREQRDIALKADLQDLAKREAFAEIITDQVKAAVARALAATTA